MAMPKPQYPLLSTRPTWEELARSYGAIATDLHQRILAFEKELDETKAAALFAAGVAARLERRFPSTPPPSTGPQRRLESILAIDESDITVVKQLKAQVAELAQRDAAEVAIAAADTRRLKVIAAGLGIIVALCAIGATVWGLFRVAVAQAH